jgi:hypothetical protein
MNLTLYMTIKGHEPYTLHDNERHEPYTLQDNKGV